MGKPRAPDPAETARAQSGMNRETAITQYGLGATNQVTPYGSLTYKQIGTWPDGTPRYEATTSLSQGQQGLYDNFTKLATQLGSIGNRQAGVVGDTLSQPFKLGNEETEKRLFELGSKRLDPRFAQERQRVEQDLANRGVKMGSDAYDKTLSRFGEGENDAYNQLLLTGRAQAANESLAERNQPLTELMSILGGTQPQSPQFQSTPQPGVANVDYAGLVANNYNQQMSNWQGGMGGLFGLGAGLLSGGGGFGMPRRAAGLF